MSVSGGVGGVSINFITQEGEGRLEGFRAYAVLRCVTGGARGFEYFFHYFYYL